MYDFSAVGGSAGTMEARMKKPQNTVVAAFSEEQAERLSGVRRGQLRYWDKTGFFAPGYGEGSLHADGFGRVYSFADIVSLRVLGILRNQYGVSVQHLRQTKELLLAPNRNTWAGVGLYVHNKRVIWLEPGTDLPQEIASRQYLVETIKLEEVVAKTKGDIKSFGERKSEQIGKVESRKMVSQSAPVLAGTRIPVRAIQRFHEAGYTADQIILEYPDLTLRDIKAALEYQKAA